MTAPDTPDTAGGSPSGYSLSAEVRRLNPALPAPRSLAERQAEQAWMDSETGGASLVQQWTRIFKVLARGPLRVSDIARAMGFDVWHVSHHLGNLLEAGLVEFEQRGRDRIFRLSDRVELVRESDEEILVRFKVSDLCALAVTVRDSITDVSPRAAKNSGTEPPSNSDGHGREDGKSSTKTPRKPPSKSPSPDAAAGRERLNGVHRPGPGAGSPRRWPTEP